MAALPYNPTVLLASEAFNGLVYILQTVDDSSDIQLKAVNISSSLSPSNIDTLDVTDSTPFSTSNGASFTAFTSSKGEIYTVAGQCDKHAAGASVWTFKPDGDGSSGDWSEGSLALQPGDSAQTLMGSFYLAAGAAFSSDPNGTQDLYYFGGMCPTASDESVTSWQASANYSDTLLYLEPSETQGSSMFSIEQIAARGPPIAEAGFTITPLSPTYFNSSSGNVSMQQNFVLVGGHTQTAFINMSQVAILSLPEQSWSFVPVDNPSANSVEPRSGHSAVLSEDGESVVVFGGWVGDVNTPADPQLAVIQVGDGYGGSGDWQWAAPAAGGSGPGKSGGGIYGHGAAMLPGNVMMITGGRVMGSGSGELVRRGGDANQQTFLYNITSNAWVTSYANPNAAAAAAGGSSSGGPSESTKVGLGAGLGVGLALLLLAIIAVLLCRRKKKNQRSVRDEDLRGLSIGRDNRMHSPILGFGGIDGRGGEPEAMRQVYSDYPLPRGADAYPWAPTLNEGAAPPGQFRRTSSNQAERTGLMVEIPSPTRGLRRSLHSRSGNNYWPQDEGRRSRGSGQIHPIQEGDEDELAARPEAEGIAGPDGEAGEMVTAAEMAQIFPAPLFAARRPSDPFADPPEQRSLLDGSRSPSPSSPMKERDIEILGTLTEDEVMATGAGDAAHDSQDEQAVSSLSTNSRSDRTASSLSDRSARSMVSALSQQRPTSSRGSVSRATSQQSRGIFSTRALSSAGLTSPPSSDLRYGSASPPAFNIKRRPISMQPGPVQHPRPALAPGNAPASSSPGGSPFGGGRPATPTLSQLQAEGPALLYGGSPGSGSAHQRNQSDVSADDDNDFDAEPLPGRKPPRPRSWMGSMRRALGGAVPGRGSPSPPGRSPREGGARLPLTGAQYAAVDDGLEAPPAAPMPPAAPERRASMSEVWAARRQQGARDWAAAGEYLSVEGSSSSGDAASRGTASVRDEDEEWDVESAVERRVVQLMFTVPREKLRVVNAAPDADAGSLRSGPSVRSVASARSGKGRRGVGGGRSVGSLRRVFEGDVTDERPRGEDEEAGLVEEDLAEDPADEVLVHEGVEEAVEGKGKEREVL